MLRFSNSARRKAPAPWQRSSAAKNEKKKRKTQQNTTRTINRSAERWLQVAPGSSPLAPEIYKRRSCKTWFEMQIEARDARERYQTPFTTHLGPLRRIKLITIDYLEGKGLRRSSVAQVPPRTPLQLSPES